MTISWGGLGTIWNKPVVTVYVKPIRYTYEFMENNEYFTLSFYNEDYKEDLDINNIDINSITQKEVDRFYKTEPAHRMYIGEVIDIIDRRI